MLAAAQESTPEMVANHRRNGWKWMVRAYYGPKGRKGSAKNPNTWRVGERAGDLCMEVLHKSDGGKIAEVEAFEGRSDIGDIRVTELK